MPQECNSCRAPIWWCEKQPTELNDRGLPKMAPIDHASVGDPNGNIEVWSTEVIPVKDGEPVRALFFRYLRKGQQPAEGHKRAISHFATCPEAGQWRGSNRRQ
jgi:hypothetical protein